MSAVPIPILPAIQIKRILVATDFSDAARAALPVAAAIARHYGSQVFIAHAWAPLPYSLETPVNYSVLEARQESETKSRLKALLQGPEMQGLQARTLATGGTPTEEIGKMVHDHHIDLVVLSTHGRTGFKHLLMGSVAEDLFRSLTCPVLTVGPRLSPRFDGPVEVRNILFATDLSEESKSVFPYITSLAHEREARIHVLHVLPPEVAGNPDLAVLAEPLRKELEQTLCPKISPRCNADFVIGAGDAAEEILAHARGCHADLIGFGVREASFMATHFRNTVTYKVVMAAECPVLTCRGPAKW